VSLRPTDLVAVLRWLRPGTRIAIGPAAWLNSH
jgi:L,D-peptidoglycan transpeptidase YkuD (ErfK/YbiS/YcfS/YnhG family)